MLTDNYLMHLGYSYNNRAVNVIKNKAKSGIELILDVINKVKGELRRRSNRMY